MLYFHTIVFCCAQPGTCGLPLAGIVCACVRMYGLRVCVWILSQRYLVCTGYSAPCRYQALPRFPGLLRITEPRDH